ncbi:DUF3515 domain-containing protein [Nocardiopsis coralliicola]
MHRPAAAAPAAALAALALAAAGCTGGVEVPVPEPDESVAAACEKLAGALPETLFDEERAETRPDSPLTAAWGDPAVALRCGVERPDAYQPDSQLTVVDEVAWLPEPADDPTMYTAMGYQAYVELSIPPSYTPPAQGLNAVSEAITATLEPLPDGEF